MRSTPMSWTGITVMLSLDDGGLRSSMRLAASPGFEVGRVEGQPPDVVEALLPVGVRPFLLTNRGERHPRYNDRTPTT